MKEAQPELFLLLWIVLVFGFFSASGSKLLPYILPLFPAAALLTGRYINIVEESWDGGGLFPRAHWWGIAAAIFFVFVPFIGAFVQRDYPVSYALPYTVLPTVLVLAVIGLGLWLCRQKAFGLTPFLYLVTLACVFGLLPAIRALIEPSKAERPITQAVQTLAAPDESIVGLYHYQQNAAFYTQRRIVLVDYEDELEFGFAHAADRDDWQWSTERFLKEWRSGKRLWVIVTDKGMSRTDVLGHPIEDELGDYVLVERSGHVNLITNLPLTKNR